MKTISLFIFTLLLAPLAHAQSSVQLTRRDGSVVTVSGKSLEILEMGNLVSALGKHEEACQYFGYLLRESEHTTLRNNAGVSAVLEALYYFRPYEPEVKFRYPLEIGLTAAGTKGLEDFKKLRMRLLRDAVAHFDSAILLDPRFAPAYLNKACAFTLLGETQLAQSALAEAQRAATQPDYAKTLTDLQVLLGILYYRQGDATRAEAAFQTAASQGSSAGAHNLRILLGQPDTVPQAPVLFGGTEKIDNWSLSSYYEIPEVDPGSEVVLGPQLKFYHNLHPGSNSCFYFSDNAATGQQTYFLLTGSNYSGQTARQLKIGASLTDIEAAYGKPKHTLETVTGQILVYPAILLILDKDKKLKQWALYGEEG